MNTMTKIRHSANLALLKNSCCASFENIPTITGPDDQNNNQRKTTLYAYIIIYDMHNYVFILNPID